MNPTQQWKARPWIRSAARLMLCPLVLPRRSAEWLLDALVPAAVAGVVRRVDLTALIVRHVDLDRVVAEVDLIGLVEEILRALDLPEIIRESTGSVVADSVHQVRLEGIAADEAVGRVRTRMFHRTGGAS